MKHTTLYPLIILLVLVTAIAIWLFSENRRTKEEMEEMVEQMTFEKEQLEDEYESLALQFDGYGGTIRNDSLAELLGKEQQRVQDLLEELRITKATNARRIAELKKELATVRAVMVEYVHQIDSLDRTNKRLTAENQEVKSQYEQVSKKATQLEEERTRLTEVVNRASMMELTSFSMTPLNNRDRKTTHYNRIQKLQFDYTIAKNITADPGMKTLYVRLVRPDGDILQKSSSHLFPYENSQIAYSLKKEFEYTGEETTGVLYWVVEEILPIGIWNADFFVDGNLIGSFPFNIKK